ncbi:MAG: ribonuclease III [Actinomycetota bacterium]
MLSEATIETTTDDWTLRVRSFGAQLGITEEHLPLLERALTHRSLADEAPAGDNERLEFLGDTVLALLVCEHLYRTFPSHTEGQLTKLKQRYVSEPSLAEAAAALDLGGLLAIATGDDVSGGRERPSTLSDAFEAVLAAVYLTQGIEAARTFVRTRLIDRVDPDVVWDYKSRLQEWCQERHSATPFYRSEPSSGPAHAPIFRSEVLLSTNAEAGQEKILGEGTGRSKKLAEQAAAQDALSRLEKPRRQRKKKAATSG